MPDINRAYTWAIQTCNAPDVRYSMTWREQQTVNGLTYYDCSSFIWYALKAGGWSLSGGAFRTAQMAAYLPTLGFRSVPITGKWLPGDIVLRQAGQLANYSNGHTEMVYRSGETNGTGITMGAHADWFYLNDGTIYYVPAEDQVSIINYVAGTDRYTTLWRYGEGADEDDGASFEGSTQYTVATMCAVWRRFTKLNPGYYVIDTQNASLTVGIAAWSGVRANDYITYYHDAGSHYYEDGNVQMDFFKDEHYWNPDNNNYATLEDFLNSRTTDFRELIVDFLAGYYETEVSTVDLDILVSYATQIREYIANNAQSSLINTWYYDTTGDLGSSEMLNNAVLVYRALSAGGGGGGDNTPILRRKYKWWLYRRKYI